jgi:hypothetical protein
MCPCIEIHTAIQEQDTARHQWLTPVILATWEADIRRIVAGDQLGQIELERLHLQNN